MNYAASEWREATKREPCPVCEKPDWCSLTGPDGAIEAVVCMRIESDNRRDNGGWLHKLREEYLPAQSPARATRAKTPKAKPAKRDATTFPTARAAIDDYRRRLGEPGAQWTYHDAAGDVALVVLRWNAPPGGKKTIRPVRRVAGGWRHEQPPVGRPLYRLPELIAGEGRVYVTEGEPAADALAEAFATGAVTTTSSGGSQAAKKTDWSPLAGRDVVLLPDNDKSGADYRDDVLARLAALATPPVVRVVELPGLPAKGDAVDWLGDGHTVEELERLACATALVALPTPERPLLYRPFPTALLPDAMRQFVEEAAAAIVCDPAMVALPALAAAAGAIGATRVLRLKRTWYEPAVLWCVLVSPSGVMKSQGRKLVLAPILKRQKRELAAYNEALATFGPLQTTFEKDLAQWKRSKSDELPPEAPEKPELRELIISDTTVEAVAKALRANERGLLLDRDELAAWFGSFDAYKSGGGDAQNWMNMHGAGFIKVNRSSLPAPIFVDRACVSISGTIQPGILCESLTKRNRESGLAARLLIASPPRRAKRWSDEEVSEAVEEQFTAQMVALLDLEFTVDDDGETTPVAVRLSAAAQRRWRSFVNRHGEEALDRDGDELAAWSKLEGYAARLALVMKLFDDPAATTVDDDTLRRAIELVDWFAHEAARFYRGTQEKPEEAEARQLVEWVQAHGGAATPAEVARSGPRAYRGKAEEVEAMLTELVGRGVGAWQAQPSGAKGGRPTRTFELAPSASQPLERKRNPHETAEAEGLSFHATPHDPDDPDDGWEAA